MRIFVKIMQVFINLKYLKKENSIKIPKYFILPTFLLIRIRISNQLTLDDSRE